MKNKSFFSQIVILIVLVLICAITTITVAWLLGSNSYNIFDFENINYSNMIPALLIGGFISCFVIGIGVLFVSRSVFYKIKEYFNENNKNGGN